MAERIRSGWRCNSCASSSSSMSALILIGQCLIGEYPEVLGRPQLGGIRWQEQQVDVFGYPQVQTGVPPGAIHYQYNLFLWSRSHGPSKGGQFRFIETLVARCQTVRPEAGWTKATRLRQANRHDSQSLPTVPSPSGPAPATTGSATRSVRWVL